MDGERLDQSDRRTVVISEPHVFGQTARYGGHQYAKVFSRYGWKVILFSASFNLWRLLSHNPNVSQEYIEIWRKGGRYVEDNLVNYCLAHILPTQLRFRPPFSYIAHALYVPSIKSVLDAHGIRRVDLLWLHGNQDWLLRKAVPHSKLVVRIIDNYSGFYGGYDNFHPLMKETLLVANGVFACSERVRELYSGFFDNIKVVPNGVDFEHFAGYIGQEPDVLKSIPRPRITYVGAIAEWFDFDLVAELARRLPNCSFILFGGWNRAKPAKGTYADNIYILGPLEYAKVPAVLAYSDVGLVPFKDTELVRGVSPIKVYEYLAARLPVVSLRWQELEQERLPIYLAKDVAEFERSIAAALAMSPQERDGLRVAVRACSWEARLTDILRYVGLRLDVEEENLDARRSAIQATR